MILTTIKMMNENDLKDICSIMARQPFDVDATVGRYVLDAKSMMGLLTLGFATDINICPHTDDPDQLSQLRKDLEQWQVDWT